MRLIACHIDGFGKLSDADFSFDAGLNTLLHDNGWGKSTLAAFLRVMLYGFEGENKRNDLENERKKYSPWVGRQYGGNITFFAAGKTYVAYRSFGSKAKDDSFRLIDSATNLDSNDFSEKLGEELFQIDQASFKRTAFTEQQDLQTGGTDSISAKLSNLCEDTDDLNNYETVTDYLTKMLNNMSPSRATGSINKLNGEIGSLKVALAEKSQVEGAINELTTRINDKKSSGNAFKSELKGLKEQELLLIKQERSRAIRQQRYELTHEKERREEAYRLARATVTGRLPEEADIEEAKKNLRHLNNMELQLAEKKVSEEEARRVEALDLVFANGIPEDSELLDAERKLTELNNNRQRLQVLEAELKLQQEMYSKEMQAMGQRLNRIRFRRLYGAGIFLIFALVELVLFLNKAKIPAKSFMPLSIGLMALGLICLIVFFIIIEISYKKASRMPSCEERDEKEVEVLEEQAGIEKNTQMLNAFLARYNITADDNGYGSALNTLGRDKADYVRLSEKVTFAEKSGVLAEKITTEKKLRAFLESTGMYLTYDYQNDLQKISICRNEIINAEREYKAAEKKLADFEKENIAYQDFGDEKEEVSQYTLSEIRSRIEGIEETVTENDKLIKQEEKRREDLLEQLDELIAKEETLEQKKEELLELKKKYKVYENTLKFLKSAHEELNTRLLAPLSGSFRGHLSDIGYNLAGSATDKVFVDSHAVVTIEEAGDRRDLAFFSAGIRDLVAVAMRVALLDNMYENEKPFVILDDPFVNLDDSKEALAKEFLQKTAEDYQVLYFTCSKRFV